MIRPIQYLRGIAAMMVVWHHAIWLIPGLSQVFPFDPSAAGVDIFFVISGFIMAYTTAGKKISPAAFFAHRVVRVVPLYWGATLVLSAAVLLSHWAPEWVQFSWRRLAGSLAFHTRYPLLIPGWTLNYEMFFYAVFAVSLMAAERWRLVLITILFLSLADVGLVFGPFDSWRFIYTDICLLEFVAGMAVARLWLKGSLGQLHGRTGVIAIAAGTYLLTFVDSGVPPLLIGATLIVGGSLTPWVHGIKSRFLLELGNASYSIYLTHMFIVEALRAVHPAGPRSTVMSYAFMAVALTASAAVGWLCYRFIEKPMTVWLHGLVRLRIRERLEGWIRAIVADELEKRSRAVTAPARSP